MPLASIDIPRTADGRVVLRRGGWPCEQRHGTHGGGGGSSGAAGLRSYQAGQAGQAAQAEQAGQPNKVE